jgi:gamma-glutamylcyclotransferase (GGCT)/AIG2-like uncharacterized protein YtfP
MATDFIFAYGSNMNRSELRSWLEAAGHDSSLVLETAPAFLEGYDYVWNYYSRGRGCGTANIEQKEGSTIWGVLMEIDESLLKAFDRKEGHPYLYSRGMNRIPVSRARDGQIIPAWVYVANANKTGSRDARPSRDYKDVLTKAAVYWGFPQDYIEAMTEWEAQ